MRKPESLSFTTKPGEKIELAEMDTVGPTKGIDKQEAEKIIERNAKTMAGLARRMYAENLQSLLLVLQGMDASGKDGTIRNVMQGVNPRSCIVYSFKKPTDAELAHDFLWRVHKVVPPKGYIGIFNRSHYEDVLVVRVHNLVPQDVWEKRYEQINNFEKLLVESRVTMLKCFLHVSKEEQRKRLQERVDVPEKRWKFNPVDLNERALWSEYQSAYEAALYRCNTAHAPWHIIPADRKWYRNLIVSQLLTKTLEKMNPQFPSSYEDVEGVIVE